MLPGTDVTGDYSTLDATLLSSSRVDTDSEYSCVLSSIDCVGMFHIIAMVPLIRIIITLHTEGDMHTIISDVVVFSHVYLEKYPVYIEARSHGIQRDSNPRSYDRDANALPSELPCFC